MSVFKSVAICLFMAALDLCCSAQALGLSLLAVSRAGYSQDAALGILAAVASLVTEHGLWSGPSRCGTWA